MIMICADTSGKNLSFTATETTEGLIKKLMTKNYNTAGKMNEHLFACLDDFLKIINLNIENIDKWAVITGPGSFTGIRIGIAAISGIALGLNKPVIGLSALDAAALISGTEQITVAAKLKLNEYACKDYDFKNNIFSDIYVKILDNAPGCLTVNSGSDNEKSLTTAICSDIAYKFYTEAAAEYVRKSEAELIFDKKSR